MLIGIVLLAVALRLAYVALFGHTLNLQLSGYDVYATNLLAGNGYTRFADLHQDSDLPPLYPFFLAGVYTIFGRSAISVALVQIVFDIATILLIYAIGRRVGGEAAGLLAAAFTAFYPYLLFQNLTVNDTGIFIMLLALGIWAAYRAHDRHSWRWAALGGFAFGFAALTKTLVILILPLMIVWWWRQLSLRQAMSFGVAMIVAFGIVIVPWVARNVQLHGAFTLISTNDGSNLYQGNNPCVADYVLAGWDAQWASCLKPPPPGLSEIQESAWFRDLAFTYLRENVGAWSRLFFAKFVTLWNPDITPRALPPGPKAMVDNAVLQYYDQPLFQIARIIHLIYFTPLLILGLLGWRRAWHDNLLVGPVLMVPIAITVAYLIYHPSTRYRSPADPFWFVLAAYGAAWLWSRLRNSRRQHIEVNRN
jgi:4-amino-4-deoxy-L-arabinose transferase-like glycosyltransferase